jgi:NAD(P)H-dependent flavin oxidoreductase YrpB (nitropropane dioxygenase family)
VSIRTRFTELLGCTAPIQQAGMGWVSGVDLAAAVAEAGGLGTMAFPLAPPKVLADLLDQARARTSGVLGLNMIVPFIEDPEAIDVAADRVDLVEFFWAEPDAELVDRVHRGGALAGWQVGSLEQARAAHEAGCDLVIVQGVEAGGHLSGSRPLLPLLAEVLDAVPLPVVAAGGISTGRGVAAALAAGADAVRLGTRFVATVEADAHPVYKQALVDERDTTVTEVFATMWPDAPHRVLSSCVEPALALTEEFVGDITFGGMEMQIPVRSMVSPLSTAEAQITAMALYAGQGVGAITAVRPAGDLVRELTEQAQILLTRHATTA